MTIKIDVAEQFSARPTLRNVATGMLRDALHEKYPTLGIEPDVAAITVSSNGENSTAEHSFKTVTDCLMDIFAQQTAANLSQAQHILVAQPTSGEATPLPVDMAELSAILDRLSLVLIDGFQQATADYWSQPGIGGMSRWAWLSEQLKLALSNRLAQTATPLDDAQLKVLRSVTMFADKAQRNAMLAAFAGQPEDYLRVCIAYTAQDKDAASSDEQVPAIVLDSRMDGHNVVLLCQPSGEIKTYASLDQWTLHEPEGNIFEALAQALLEKQLHDLQALKGADAYELDTLELHLAAITDLVPLFDTPDSVTSTLVVDQLPEWLQRTSVADRIDYSRYVTQLAAVQKRSLGHSFNDDLPPIREFARRALRREMLKEHPDGADLDLNAIEVSISKVSAAALPSGGQIATLGGVEQVRMTLPQFALENLSSLPNGPMTLHRTDDQPLPDWLTPDWLRALTAQADIGEVYPKLIERYLMSESTEVQRRQVLFADQLRVQLPLLALEQKIKGEGQISDTGYRSVAAIMQASGKRRVGPQDIVIRPLALVSQPGASDDVVSNVFVIGPQDVAAGPHVLYQPFAKVRLSEFSSWSALRAAIEQPGDLQNAVLAWLPDKARLLYANGGFQEPHRVRFGQGSEFAPLEVPQPATLSLAVVSGEPTQALFAANARALVELADRNSVSNAESRWALLKKGGWLLLDAVLPFVSGPIANALWLTQLLISSEQVLATQGSPDAATRSAALADLLLNVSMILLHQRLSASEPRVPDGRPSGGTVVAQSTSSALQLPGTESTVLDFAWSNPRNQLSAAQRTVLNAFRVSPPASLGGPVASGAHEGLFLSGGRWYAQVDADVFEVSLEEDGVVVIDPKDTLRTGPWLKREGQAWQLDLGLRLRGGGPKKNARKLAEENAAKLKQITDSREQLRLRQIALFERLSAYDKQMKTATGELRQMFYLRIEKDLQEVIEVVQLKIKQGQELRPVDRPIDRLVAEDLRLLSRYITYLEGLFLQDIQAMTRHDLASLKASSEDETVVPENIDVYLNLFSKLLVMQDTGVKWAGVRESLWEQLRAVPNVGEPFWRADVLELHRSNLFTRFEWTITRLFSLLELCFNKDEILFGHDFKALKDLRTDADFHATISSHAELDKPNNYSIVEQMGVLESVLHEYGRAIDIGSYIQSLESAAVQGPHLDRFLDELITIRDSTENRLSGLIREQDSPPSVPFEYVPRVEQPRKRVFKTRGQRTLVGEVRQDQTDFPGEVVDVTDTMSQKIIGSYHQHPGGEWVEIVEARPARPAPKPSTLPLAELQRQALELLEQVDPVINSARRQSKRASEPEDMEDILTHKARKLTELADRLEAFGTDEKLADAATIKLTGTLVDLRAAATRLIEEGRSIRIDMIKSQPPTAARISYLDRQREVNIAKIDGLKNMSGARRDDFLQEYVIRDKDNRTLWWAHFHYATEDASPAAFTAAHLKLPEQRRLGYKALLKSARDNKEVVSIYRSTISKEPAQRLFLGLATQAAAVDDSAAATDAV